MDGESTSYRAYAERNWLHLKGEAFIVWFIKEMIRGGKDARSALMGLVEDAEA